MEQVIVWYSLSELSFASVFVPEVYRAIQYGNSMVFVRILMDGTDRKSVLERISGKTFSVILRAFTR